MYWRGPLAPVPVPPVNASGTSLATSHEGASPRRILPYVQVQHDAAGDLHGSADHGNAEDALLKRRQGAAIQSSVMLALTVDHMAVQPEPAHVLCVFLQRLLRGADRVRTTPCGLKCVIVQAA